MASTIPPAPTTGTGLDRGLRIGLGIGLLLPAVLALLGSYVLPSALAVYRSTTRDNLIGPAEGVGLDNYQAAFDDGFVGSLWLTALLALVPLLVGLVVAPLLALLADRAGRAARSATRVLLVLPVACYAPVGLLIGWRTDRLDVATVVEHPYATMFWLTAVTSAGLVVAVATTLFLAALRGGSPWRARLSAALTVAGVLAIGILATVLQIFDAAVVLGARRDGSWTPLTEIVTLSLMRFEIGRGSASVVLLLAPLMLLGVAAVGLLLITRARIEVDPTRQAVDTTQRAAGRVPARIGLAVALTVLVAAGVWIAFPWLRRIFQFQSDGPFGGGSPAETVIATWLPTLVASVVSVGIAALAGFAIGGLRPLGRHSELLLLPFAPWLFVGTGPLAIESYVRARDLGLLDSMISLIPPGWVSIPTLVAFALLGRGQHARWQAGGGFTRTMLLPALPMLALAGLLTWLFNAGQLLWPWLVAQGPSGMPATVSVFRLFSGARAEADGLGFGLLLPVPLLLLFLAAFVALQLTYLDRLAIRVGQESDVSATG
ncbi:sugar ABC transporter permease [Solwaraspora sp. WMMD406]|uniref:sugar ABC transporter permease n=1 Tax=Solwaraspora sp. WMMD406 TaxID=3016095 RepID=UPI0024162259|nr:sugar ABC transporter permease [Solwaraspora sp. WMMD406]MDG4765950.1 sugar ABC transporter permease [Solwaraspora sp. WMMD406]